MVHVDRTWSLHSFTEWIISGPFISEYLEWRFFDKIFYKIQQVLIFFFQKYFAVNNKHIMKNENEDFYYNLTVCVLFIIQEYVPLTIQTVNKQK